MTVIASEATQVPVIASEATEVPVIASEAKQSRFTCIGITSLPLGIGFLRRSVTCVHADVAITTCTTS